MFSVHFSLHKDCHFKWKEGRKRKKQGLSANTDIFQDLHESQCNLAQPTFLIALNVNEADEHVFPISGHRYGRYVVTHQQPI